MKITKRSGITGKTHTLDLPITKEEFEKGLEKYKEGALIQHAFPTLSAAHREFLLTGTTLEEWDEVLLTGTTLEEWDEAFGKKE